MTVRLFIVGSDTLSSVIPLKGAAVSARYDRLDKCIG